MVFASGTYGCVARVQTGPKVLSTPSFKCIVVVVPLASVPIEGTAKSSSDSLRVVRCLGFSVVSEH